jgi:hypothetical protein
MIIYLQVPIWAKTEYAPSNFPLKIADNSQIKKDTTKRAI